MKDSAEKYFELLPVLLVALIMLAAEYRQTLPPALERIRLIQSIYVPPFEPSLHDEAGRAPRAIFR